MIIQVCSTVEPILRRPVASFSGLLCFSRARPLLPAQASASSAIFEPLGVDWSEEIHKHGCCWETFYILFTVVEWLKSNHLTAKN